MSKWKILGAGLLLYGGYRIFKDRQPDIERTVKHTMKKEIVKCVEWCLFDEQRDGMRKTRTRHYIFTFNSRDEAFVFLRKLTSYIIQQGYVRVAVAKLLINSDIVDEDLNRGWTSLKSVYGRATKDGHYKLYFPKSTKMLDWRER